ncbi:MAG: 5'/3'-nucleotidase SurE [Rhodothermales bacterium]|nr:5'/3'-nucleotidase SurE [Rhodothermales bacterium]
MGQRKRILICNDDGIDAAGINALAESLSEIADIFVIAPIDEQSAVGHAITMRTPVRARPWPFRYDHDRITAYAVSGTPADCIKIAVDKLMPQKPDLVVSGINHGPNAAVNVIYSGTVSAATEASILGVDSIAFSLCAWKDWDFDPAKVVARTVVERVLDEGLPPGVLLNVNIPAIPLTDIQGYQVTRQARSRWEEEFDERTDPFNETYYWLTGRFVNLDDGANTDLEAIESGFVSVTPIKHDLTAHGMLEDVSRRLQL